MNIEQIWASYGSALKTFLHSKLSNNDDVDDILQEILIKSHNNLHSVKDLNHIKSWLFSLANNTIIDFYRKRAAGPDLNEQTLWFGADDDQLRLDLSACIVPFIKALPAASAELLMTVDIHGQSQKDYAQAQGISYSTLKSRVQKARRELRSLFDSCCHFSLDPSGRLIDFDEKSGRCKKC